MGVNISATFKKDEKDFNGLEGIRKELIEDPLTRRVIVAVIETKSITTDVYGGGVQTPTIRLVHVEALDGERAAAARTLLNQQFTERTGRTDNQPTLFEGDEPSSAPQSDPTAGPWPGDTDYPAEPSMDLSEGPETPPTRKGRQ